MLQTRLKYNLVLRLLHWAMAALILCGFFIGVGMSSSAGPDYLALAAWHRPVGLTVLGLVLLRLTIRIASSAPAFPRDMPRLQAAAARTAHLLLYASMFAMPLLGWAMISAAGKPVVVIPGTVLPDFVSADPALHATLRTAHSILAYSLFALIIVHLAAALHHRIARRDGVFDTMTLP